MSLLQGLLEKVQKLASRSKAKKVQSLAQICAFWLLKVIHCKDKSLGRAVDCKLTGFHNFKCWTMQRRNSEISWTEVAGTEASHLTQTKKRNRILLYFSCFEWLKSNAYHELMERNLWKPKDFFVPNISIYKNLSHVFKICQGLKDSIKSLQPIFQGV